MRITVTLLLSISIFLSFSVTYSTNLPISPSQYQPLLKTGIDVDWATFQTYIVEYQKYHDKNINIPKMFKNRGFDHIRIRMRDLSLSSYDPKTDKTYLQELKNIVNDCLKADIIPILTYSASTFRETPDSSTLDKSVNFWKELAKDFKNYPYLLSYDLVIETSGKISDQYQLLNSFYQKSIKAIRAIDKDRLIFITPAKVSNPYYLPKLWYPKNDKYIMIEWHFYAAGPSKTNKNKLWTIGTNKEKQLILSKISFAKKWCKEKGFYSWVGAWMPTNYNKFNRKKTYSDGAPAGGYYTLDQEINFASFMAKSLKNAKIPFSINADGKFFDLEKLSWYKSVKPVLDVIIN